MTGRLPLLLLWSALIVGVQANISLYEGYYRWTVSAFTNGTEIVPHLGQALRLSPVPFQTEAFFSIAGELVDGDDFHFDAQFVNSSTTDFVRSDETVYWTSKKCLDDLCPNGDDGSQPLARARVYREKVRKIVRVLDTVVVSGDVLTLSGPVGTLQGVRADDPVASRSFRMASGKMVLIQVLLLPLVVMIGWL